MAGKLNKILVIFNPLAGLKYQTGYRESFLQDCQKLLPDAIFDWLETTPDLQSQLSRQNLSDYNRLIVIGGDGTIKAVADFLLKNNSDLPLAVIPQGSANVLASALNIPLNQKKAVARACLGQEKKIDVGVINGQEYFLICLSLGYWSKIVKATGRNLKIRLGFGAYLLNFLKQRRIDRAIFKFILDGRPQEVFGNTLVVANALSFFKLRPKTPIDFSDGCLEVLIMKNRSLVGFLNVLWSFFLGKKRFPALFKAKGKRIILDLTAKMAEHLQLDGETMKLNQEKLGVEIIPNKLKIVI